MQISIDDFGTGYSSLSYLKGLEVDEVKIDRCFVRQIHKSSYNYRLLSNMLELTQEAQIRVCCEGVEEEEELRCLDTLSPELIQGYFFGKPMSADEFESTCLATEGSYNKFVTELRKRYHDHPVSARTPESASTESIEYKNILDSLKSIIYVVDKENINRAVKAIEEELEERVKEFKRQDKLLEAQRIAERTNFDIEMMKETGFCSGIENYSRHLAGLAPGQAPYTLIDYFPDDFVIMIDESHKTIPQIGGMYSGDQSRKSTLVDYGFRLPSAKDNRPLNFEEFESKINQVLFVSATPGVYEEEHELLRAEQVIRPTGLLDPEVEVRPVEGQIDDLIGEINQEISRKNKVLVTTLTKRMAEDLTDYMREIGIRVKYLHSDVDTLERTEIIRDMRLDVFDVLVGINLLREGLDIPEITLVAILDADKEGFLRSETSLIQTIGRAARNSEGHVIMYADKLTDSMRLAIDETERRRKIQMAYNEEHGITPKTIQKAVRDQISISKKVAAEELKLEKDPESMSRKELEKLIGEVTKRMKKAAAELDFESAAELRDKLIELKQILNEIE